ncbi:MAG: hypothetical protein EZS28_049628, partial [Streblomastix strix]
MFNIGQSHLLITNSNFSAISSVNINGSIISEKDLGSLASINLSNIRFSKCVGTTEDKQGRGSVIYIGGKYLNTKMQLNDLLFSECKIDNSENVMYISTDSLKQSFPNAVNFPFVNDTNSRMKYAGFDYILQEIPLYQLWKKYESDSVYVGPIHSDLGNVGRNELFCGQINYPCLTLDYSYDHLKTNGIRNINIIETTQINFPIIVQASLTVQKDESTKDTRAQIMIINKFSPIPISLFTVQQGFLTLNDIEFTSFADFRNNILIHYTSSDNLTFNNFAFKGVGYLLDAELDTKNKVLINDSIFYG